MSASVCRLLFGLCLATSAIAAAAPPSFEPAVVVVGHRIKLNGSGVQAADSPKAQGVALYLSKKSVSLAQALQAPGPKRLQLQLLQPLSGQELGSEISRAINANVPRNELSDCLPGLLALGEVFSARKKLAAGETLSLDGVPGYGTYVAIGGERVTHIKHPAFFGCLLHAYLGAQSSDAGLRKALLGG